MKYFYNKQIREITLPEQGYKVGVDWNEKNTFVLLTDNQLAFCEANPKASPLEVYNCLPNPAPEPYVPTPEDLFNPEDAISDMRLEFKENGIALSPYMYLIEQNTRSKNFTYLNDYTKGLLLYNIVTNTELEKFREIFSLQDINLINYV